MAQRRAGRAARFALALRSSEEQGAIAVEAAELGTLRWDTDRETITASRRAADLLGWHGEASRGEADAAAGEVLAAIHADDRARLTDAVVQV